MLGFIVGLFVGVCAAIIFIGVWQERHEYIHDACSRCGRSFGDWERND